MEAVMKKIAELNEKHNELTNENAERLRRIQDLERENLEQAAVLAEQSKEISELYEMVDKKEDNGGPQ